MLLEEILYLISQNVAKTLCGRAFGSDRRYRGFIFTATMQRLAEALLANTSLTALDLPYNTTHDSEVVLLADVLVANTRLISLNLSKTLLVETGSSYLAKALMARTSFKAINLSYDLKNEFGGYFYECMAKAIQVNPTLTSIGLTVVDSNRGLIALAEAWCSSTSLASIHLPRLGAMQPSGYQALVSSLYDLPLLTSLNLQDSDINGIGAELLAEYLKVNRSLTSINLSYALTEAGEEKDHILEALKINDTLTSVNLSGYKKHSFSAQPLAEVIRVNTNLKSIVFKNNKMTCRKLLLQSLAVNTVLTSLDLSQCAICLTDTDANALKEALIVNASLVSLNLSESYIDTNGALALSQALVINSTLTYLGLYKNTRIGQQGVTALMSTLKKNTTLTSINLAESAPSLWLIHATADLLSVNTSLTSISLPTRRSWQRCAEDDADSQILFEALRTNLAITYFLGYSDFSERWRHGSLEQHYGSQAPEFLRRNQRRSLLVTSPRGLKNTILYSLFSKPLTDEGIIRGPLPHIIQFQLTPCAIELQVLHKDILGRAIMAGWCCACGAWGKLGSSFTDKPDYSCSYELLP
jgi:Ran GTPase-activating protein (RanGAP) involved in mRNA processing and transport